MFHLFHFGNRPRPPYSAGGLLFYGLLFVFFGLAILGAPDLLAYFVASILLFIGASLLTAWWKLR